MTSFTGPMVTASSTSLRISSRLSEARSRSSCRTRSWSLRTPETTSGADTLSRSATSRTTVSSARRYSIAPPPPTPPLPPLPPRAAAGPRLDAADARGSTPLGHDFEEADLGRVVQVGAAAEFAAVVIDLHHAHAVAVFLPEEGHGALTPRVLVGRPARAHGQRLEDPLVDAPLDGRALLRREGGEVREVEAQPVGRHQRSRLLGVIPQHFVQCPVQQVGGGVVAHDVPPPRAVERGADAVADADLPPRDAAAVDDDPLPHLLRVRHGDLAAAGADAAGVADLAAALRIEGRAVEDDLHLLAFPRLLHPLPAPQQGQHLGAGLGRLVAQEGRGGYVTEDARGYGLRLSGEPARRAGALALPRHRLLEPRLVHGEVLLARHVAGHLQGEAEGVVEAEDGLTGQDGAAALPQFRDRLVQTLQPHGEGLAEALLLGDNGAADELPALRQFRIDLAHRLYDRVGHLAEERPPQSHPPAVPHGPAHDHPPHLS